MSWHVEFFTAPRGEAARRLAELRSRRRELLAERREAVSASEESRAELDAAGKALERAEARSLAFGEADAPAAKKALTRAKKAADEAAERDGRLGRAVQAVDDEMKAHAVEHLEEVIGELAEDHAAAAGRAEDAVRAMREAHAELLRVHRAAHALLTAVDPPRNRSLRAPASLEAIVAEGAVAGLFMVAAPVGPLVRPEHDPDPAVREAARAAIETGRAA
jgi:chromosome segregation ATPase